MNTPPEFEDITPERALELIGKASVSYVTSRLDRRVARYAELMATGQWQESPNNVIPVTADGYLIDCLNRLMAIVLSGTTQRFAVIDAGTEFGREAGFTLHDIHSDATCLLPKFHGGPRWCELPREAHPEKDTRS